MNENEAMNPNVGRKENQIVQTSSAIFSMRNPFQKKIKGVSIAHDVIKPRH